ncbi:cobalt-precorrin 5A hydrolase / precorrin-3B C17-methyltransferase [Dehalogenimonas formicexedens]|uniref:Cobalt-precorrin 5A hydrolase / precorrin-3B C17-methyltransferase n=1 Tax=Dehalogenimonas formicexedens TaxID=1839801 RepID=A0A1P8F9F5_9CHLR|nr:precorrin-3B C(17)-methyltransferase [Dehalogenimonas formicexedens]APV45097.1 cobalt-precorrin 5A hydrolase / precorrin-3B C17-methyltransferase [Dehalogenimonas formicexedens]
MDTVKLTIVAVTKNGTALGRRLRSVLPHSELYAQARFLDDPQSGEHPYEEPVGELIGRLFKECESMALIMANGIAVRAVAPYLKDKKSDPAVVVLDEGGENIISLLSGHLGGANALTQKIAALLGAHPVVTTASDVSHNLSPDNLAARYGWLVEPGSDLTGLAAALVNGDPVGVFQDSGETDWQATVNGYVTVYPSIDTIKNGKVAARLAITNRMVELDHAIPSVVFHPRNLVVGIGCNRGTTATEIDKAINTICQRYGLSPMSISSLASVDLKKDEQGLLEYSVERNVPLRFFPAARLAEIPVPSAPSEHALTHAGTPSVAEAAALLASGATALLVEKQAVDGQVTVAVAESVTEAKSNGKLSVVGIGPGDFADMSFRARQAIDEAEVIVGYKMYLDLIRPLLAGKTLLSSGMTKEVDRTQEAVKSAGAGKNVALISSGDAGIYGMAGLAFEVAAEMKIPVEIVVVPGISAVSAAASLLGAPLMTDFCTISLSDYLTDWPRIEKRLEYASKADFVIALYNPKSRKRPHLLEKAVNILLNHRGGGTPVGIVSDAYRPEQMVVITDLENLPKQDVGMTSIVIIGNSQTEVIGGRMVTSRGYQKKYELGETSG